ncbi:DUF1651 domain-containing protein [Prochlorococcus sp. AH-716-K03]|nr:DUF1651 domain-containing protein [Prochlorococcus sp. AH-716-K03]
MKKENDFWLIDSNYVGVVRFYKKNKNEEDLIEYMFIEEGIVMGSHGENPPLMKTRKEMKIEDARLFWKNLIDEGWQKTNPKW